MTCFDDLSIDLLLKIFNYLSFTELFKAFFGLKKRLDNVIQDYPACINLSNIINHHDLENYLFKCRSLILTGLDLHSFQIKYSHLNLTYLRCIIFKKMNLLTLRSFFEILPIGQLESIIIQRFIWHYYPIDLYEQVWFIIMNSINGNCLRYLHLPYHIHYWNMEKLSFDFSVLKHAILEYISLRQMLIFISHCPNLRRFKACLAATRKDIFPYAINHSKLNHLTLNLHDEWSLKQIEYLLTICPYLKYLILKLEARKEMKIMFEPTTWQTLIVDKLPCLTFLRLRLNCIIVHLDVENENFQEKFNLADYWYQRKSHFQVAINEIHREVL